MKSHLSSILFLVLAACVSAARKTAVIAGSSGYIGRSVVRESVLAGYRTIALVRNATKAENDPMLSTYFAGAEIVECDVSKEEELSKKLQEIKDQSGSIDAFISCLASRSGYRKDSYKVDYKATLNFLQASQAIGTGHFVLLSAFCVKKPLLHFQHAKLKFEAALQAQKDVTWSIVRPTAFFKSVSSQMERVRDGGKFIIFGGGADTACNPIAESDLARYLLECVSDPSKENKILNVGGPDEPITKRMQGEMIFKALGRGEAEFAPGPSVGVLRTFRKITQVLHFLTRVPKLENVAETFNILTYYITEDMLTTEHTEKFGSIRLQDHYDQIAREGTEYDPYVSMMVKQTTKQTVAAEVDQTFEEERRKVAA